MRYPVLLLALIFGMLVSCHLALTQEETATKDETANVAAEHTGDVAADENVEQDGEEHREEEVVQNTEPVQEGPLIDLFGEHLYSFEFLEENKGQINAHYTNEALSGKKVVGLYFSADWCGPCRQFTPELVSFYERMNNRRGKKDQFEIVWVSRCRDGNSYAQYFSQMPWLALPPEEAMGARGQQLGEKYKVKSIPSLVLVDDLGNTITIDARNKIPQDKAGIGFPWRDPISQLFATLVPRSLRLLVKTQIDAAKKNVVGKLKAVIGLKKKTPV